MFSFLSTSLFSSFFFSLFHFFLVSCMLPLLLHFFSFSFSNPDQPELSFLLPFFFILHLLPFLSIFPSSSQAAVIEDHIPLKARSANILICQIPLYCYFLPSLCLYSLSFYNFLFALWLLSYILYYTGSLLRLSEMKIIRKENHGIWLQSTMGKGNTVF